MTPEEPSGEDRALDPAQEQAVSDLLAGARAERSVPADVGARLDDVLAGLVAERGGETETAGETEAAGRDEPAAADLAERRRRRWPGLLVAAAAVTVVGLGLGNVLETGLGGAADQSGGAGVASDESRAEAGPEADAPAGGRAETDDGAAVDPKASPDVPLAGSAERRLMRLRSDSLALDIQRLAEFALVTDQGRSAPQALAACVRPQAPPDADVLAVRFDGAPATLVLRAPRDGVRRADVYACDEATAPLASTSVTVE